MTLPLKAPSFIEWTVQRSLPFRTAEEADKEIIRLVVEVMRWQAELHAAMIKEGM